MKARFKSDLAFPCPGRGAAMWPRLRGRAVVLGEAFSAAMVQDGNCGSDTYWRLLGPPDLLAEANRPEPLVCRHILDIGD
jgi:hypothetical protein